MSCLFCDIATKKIPAKVVREDEYTIAFHDINPAAPTHVLVIPKKHLTSISDATEADAALLGHLMLAAKTVAQELGVQDGGYRIVLNTGTNGGQSVLHLHAHVLGGRALAWPPG
ncbi:MAG: histidine triad nucleotide-binding protein [Sandaracinaceae bacterium]|nr:histidine triad nucleotide-binding protein [Sandaracinaceae bacterium]